jgi:TonB-linked SusC/RagA family outer membrane protein
MIKYYLSCLLVVCTFLGNAQSVLLKGKVQDSNTQELLPSVSIVEKGGTNGAITKADGSFEFYASSPNSTLVFSFIGYAPLELALKDVKDPSNLQIQLIPEKSELNEVVVTALGLEQETYTVGYTVQGLKAKDIAEVKSPNFVDNLAGNIAGVTVSQGATGVGSTSKITIRGEASFTNNNPLFIVDGIPINNNTALNISDEAAAGFQEVDFGNGAMELNQDDISSVTVLKGPGAAALYGTRAANGAIIITTKDGSNTDGFRVSLNTSTFIETPFQLPEFQNQYGQGNSGQFEFVDGLGGGTNDNITYSWGPRLDQGTLISQFDSPVTLANGSQVRGGDVAVHGGAAITPTAFVSHPDNLKDFYRTGYTTNNNIAVSSGFNGGNYRFSISDLRSESPIPGVNLNRNTISTHLNFTPSDKLKISTSINYINSRSDNRPSSGYGSENINYSLVAWGPRSLDIGALEDYWQPGLENLQQYSFNYTFFDNPYFILLENRNAFDRDRLLGSIQAEYSFTDHLSLSVQSGMDYSDELRQFRRAYSTNRFRTGAYAEQDVFFREINSSFLLNYRKQYGVFNLNASFGGNRMDQFASNTQTQTLSLAQPGIYNFSNADAPLQVFQQTAEKRINSFYGFVKLGYSNILFLQDVTIGLAHWPLPFLQKTPLSFILQLP